MPPSTLRSIANPMPAQAGKQDDPSSHASACARTEALVALAGWLSELAESVEELDVMDLERAETILRDVGQDPHFFAAATQALNAAALELLGARELALDAIRLRCPDWARDARELHLRACCSTLVAVAFFVDTRADALMRHSKAQSERFAEFLVIAKQDATDALASMNAALSR